MYKLLIVDDCLSLLEILQIALGENYDIRCARCGEAGLDMAESWKPDVIITDYSMAGMNGIEFIEKTRGLYSTTQCLADGQAKTGKNTPTPIIVFYSALLTDDLRRKAIAAGANECFPKPFDVNRIRVSIEKQINCSTRPGIESV